MKVNAVCFLDWEFTLDSTNFDLCRPYLKMRFYPTPALDTFINKRFNTKEELNNINNSLKEIREDIETQEPETVVVPQENTTQN